MDYSSENKSTCPIGFEVAYPRISKDDRIEVVVKFYYKIGERRNERKSFDDYDNTATVLLDREAVTDYLPKTSSGTKLSSLDNVYEDRCSFIQNDISSISFDRDRHKIIFMNELARAYSNSNGDSKKSKCEGAINYLVKNEDAYDKLKEFVRCETLLTLVRKPAVFHSDEVKTLFA